jgi:NitT/TauT family transport system permease protein
VANGLIGFLYPLPKSAVFPLLLLIFGIDGGAHVALIAMGAVALMLTTTIAGLSRLEAAGYMEVARILKLKRGQFVVRVLLPGLLPEFVHGLKLGASYGLVLLVVSEMLATRFGIGVFLWAAWDQFKVLDLYAALFLISGVGFVIYGALDAVGTRFQDSQRSV